MVSARDEFEAWRRHKLAELGQEKDHLSTRRESLKARFLPARPAGAAGEEIARSVEAFLRSRLIRWEAPTSRHGYRSPVDDVLGSGIRRGER